MWLHQSKSLASPELDSILSLALCPGSIPSLPPLLPPALLPSLRLALALVSPRLPSLGTHVLSRHTVVSLRGRSAIERAFSRSEEKLKRKLAYTWLRSAGTDQQAATRYVVTVERAAYQLRQRTAAAGRRRRTRRRRRRRRRRCLVAGRRVQISCRQISAPLPFHWRCPSQTLCRPPLLPPLLADTFSSGPDTGLTGTGNKHGSLASACYVKDQVHVDAYGILSPIDLPSAFHISTF